MYVFRKKISCGKYIETKAMQVELSYIWKEKYTNSLKVWAKIGTINYSKPNKLGEWVAYHSTHNKWLSNFVRS